MMECMAGLPPVPYARGGKTPLLPISELIAGDREGQTDYGKRGKCQGELKNAPKGVLSLHPIIFLT